MEGEACTTISVYEILSKNQTQRNYCPLQEAEALPFCECKDTTFTRNGKRKGQKNHMDTKKNIRDQGYGGSAHYLLYAREGGKKERKEKGKQAGIRQARTGREKPGNGKHEGRNGNRHSEGKQTKERTKKDRKEEDVNTRLIGTQTITGTTARQLYSLGHGNTMNE